MRAFTSVFAAALLLGAASVQAEELTRSEALAQLARPDASARVAAIERLASVGTMADAPALVKALRDPDTGARAAAEDALWHVWSRSGSDAVDAVFESGMRQMESGDYPQAIATFTRVIEMKPDFAEGWNKRATLYFLTGDLRRSLADCDEVVKRNPQHFGVLSGYAQIYAQLGYYDRALDYARRALAVNPNLTGMRDAVEMLEHVQAERRKQSI
jgi:tetratricopeptide (TPR) repeat protein